MYAGRLQSDTWHRDGNRMPVHITTYCLGDKSALSSCRENALKIPDDLLSPCTVGKLY